VIATAAALGMSGATAATAAPVRTIFVPCSVNALRASIFFAPGDSILSLVSGCVYRLNSALPDVRRNITIQGNHDTIRRNSGTYTALEVDDAMLTINRLNMIGFRGRRDRPGAIDNDGGTVTITNSNFAFNDGGEGGAIRNDNGGSLSVTSSGFLRNEAFSGGAIDNRGRSTATVDISTFVNNEADTGGAIFVASGHVTVEGTGTTAGASTQFVGNKALGRDDGVAVGEAGAVKPDAFLTGFGGAIDNLGGSLSITYAIFNGNAAEEDGGAVWNGGGTSSIGTSGFRSNFADDDGGAIATTKSLNLFSDTLTLNRARDDGGGIYVNGGRTSLSRTDVFANSAGGTGGGIRRNNGNVSLTNFSLVTLNRPNNCSGFIFGC